MTTQAWATRVRHDSDAVFREWGSELNTRLAACGLVQTADTGQINWATVVRAGTNANAGYEIWRFNDALQATVPIYIRIDYGTNANATAPRMQFTVGTGTDGAGTLTGTALTIARVVHSNAVQTTDTARNSYACHVEGFFGLNWKQGAGAAEAFFAIERTRDNDGDATGTGAIVVWGGGAVNGLTATQALRFAATAVAYTAQTATANTALGISPQTPSTSAVGSDLQVFLGYTITPRAEPLLGLCGVLDGEFPTGNTFPATLIGSTSHTYLALSTIAGPFTSVNAGGAGPKFAMIWE